MPHYTVTTSHDIVADSAEEAALIVYKELTSGEIPLYYTVADEAGSPQDLALDRDKADEYAATDNTADPGNW